MPVTWSWHLLAWVGQWDRPETLLSWICAGRFLKRDPYSRRTGIIEPVFADIRHAKGMNRFHYKGRTKAAAPWLLYCLVHNLGKIAGYGASHLATGRIPARTTA
jgi:hypothetical protein